MNSKAYWGWYNGRRPTGVALALLDVICARLGRTTAFCVIAYVVGALMEESAAAWTIFFRVPIKAYLC